MQISFNSLQTGKSFRTNQEFINMQGGVSGFNSLQTGKSFRTVSFNKQGDPELENVSIPFKRESPFGRKYKPCNPSGCRDGFNSLQTGKSFRTYTASFEELQRIVFQFPSNGKVLSDPMLEERERFQRTIVSIPFKRESPFGLQSHNEDLVEGSLVSIPFKRESPFGPSEWNDRRKKIKGFNSLQTGKSFRTIEEETEEGIMTLFQFPSNGKVLSDERGLDTDSPMYVFQFPSNGKVLSDKFEGELNHVEYIKFQFPSNGKVLSDLVITRLAICWYYGFNSLQTGKSFRTKCEDQRVRLGRNRFNSLQTGKSFRTKNVSE